MNKAEPAYFGNVRCYRRATCSNMAAHRVFTGSAWFSICTPCAGKMLDRGRTLLWLNGTVKPTIPSWARP